MNPVSHNNFEEGSMPRRHLIVASAGLATLPLAAWSQESSSTYPNHPVRIVVPYPPGAINDTLARAIAERLQASLGQPFVVDNRAGGGAVIGTQSVATAPADGYTLLQVPVAHVINAALGIKLPYDTLKSFSFISLAFRAPALVMVRENLPARTMQDLLSLAKSKPGALTYGSTGNGGAAHLMGEKLKQMTGVNLLHVPYKGAAPAMTDLMGGQIDLTFATYTAALTAIQAGRARAIAVTGSKRLSMLPDVPTVAESGVRGYEAFGWWGFAAPAGTPAAIVSRLNKEILAALELPALRNTCEAQGIEIIGTTPKEFEDYVRREIAVWTKVIKDGRITAD